MFEHIVGIVVLTDEETDVRSYPYSTAHAVGVQLENMLRAGRHSHLLRK
jgi:hypothetical protein